MTERMTAEQARRELAKARGQQPETAIKRQLKDYLRTLGYFVYHNLQGVGCYKGIPDLVAVKFGAVYFIEAKTAAGKLSAHQEKFRDDLTEHGGRYIVARDIEDVARMGDR